MQTRAINDTVFFTLLFSFYVSALCNCVLHEDHGIDWDNVNGIPS